MLDSERWDLEQRRRQLDRLTVLERHHRALYGQPTARRQAAPATTARRTTIKARAPKRGRSGAAERARADRGLAVVEARQKLDQLEMWKRQGRVSPKMERLMLRGISRDQARAAGRKVCGPIERVTVNAAFEVEDGTIKGVLR